MEQLGEGQWRKGISGVCLQITDSKTDVNLESRIILHWQIGVV